MVWAKHEPFISWQCDEFWYNATDLTITATTATKLMAVAKLFRLAASSSMAAREKKRNKIVSCILYISRFRGNDTAYIRSRIRCAYHVGLGNSSISTQFCVCGAPTQPDRKRKPLLIGDIRNQLDKFAAVVALDIGKIALSQFFFMYITETGAFRTFHDWSMSRWTRATWLALHHCLWRSRLCLLSGWNESFMRSQSRHLVKRTCFPPSLPYYASMLSTLHFIRLRAFVFCHTFRCFGHK